ncbi:hypothetical protein Psuf_060520 [Phytohabitans suffuscus]|uniref:Uncharacterized protein n=1 Tax=Phytohabitans suffuscus TaxID=624315 RepID=A0A6F8YRQ0_9ACTN|nr:hypothetical protein Psuf_060520 [Phytohabitans suffuscus]
MMVGVEADLQWQLNSTLSIGPWPVHVSTDASHARLRDLDALEDLRDIHNWDPMFTLRFSDGITRDVAVSRPDDDGSFTLIDADAAAAIEAATTSDQDPNGLLPEPADVASATAWLHEHGFATREHSRGGKLSGSRLFERSDGWQARYSCVLGTWSLELSPPEHHRFTSFHRLRRDKKTAWRDALPTLIDDPPHDIDAL